MPKLLFKFGVRIDGRHIGPKTVRHIEDEFFARFLINSGKAEIVGDEIDLFEPEENDPAAAPSKAVIDAAAPVMSTGIEGAPSSSSTPPAGAPSAPSTPVEAPAEVEVPAAAPSAPSTDTVTAQ